MYVYIHVISDKDVQTFIWYANLSLALSEVLVYYMVVSVKLIHVFVFSVKVNCLNYGKGDNCKIFSMITLHQLPPIGQTV